MRWPQQVTWLVRKCSDDLLFPVAMSSGPQRAEPTLTVTPACPARGCWQRDVAVDIDVMLLHARHRVATTAECTRTVLTDGEPPSTFYAVANALTCLGR